MVLIGEVIHHRTFYKTTAPLIIGDRYISLALVKTAPGLFEVSDVRGRIQMGKIHATQYTFSSRQEAEQDFDKRCRDALSTGYELYNLAVHGTELPL